MVAEAGLPLKRRMPVGNLAAPTLALDENRFATHRFTG
jgi:hypothetical protein